MAISYGSDCIPSPTFESIVEHIATLVSTHTHTPADTHIHIYNLLSSYAAEMSWKVLKNALKAKRRRSQPPERVEENLRIEDEMTKIRFDLKGSAPMEIQNHLVERIKGGNSNESDYFSWEKMTSDEKRTFQSLFQQFRELKGISDEEAWKGKFKRACERFWKEGSGSMWRNAYNPDDDSLPIQDYRQS